MNRFNILPDITTPLDGTEYVEVFQAGKSVRLPLYKILSISLLAITTAPVAFTATMVDYQSINLSWTNGATNYILERSMDSSSWVQVYNGASGSFSDTGLHDDNQYFYRLKAQVTGQYDSEFVFADATTDVLP